MMSRIGAIAILFLLIGWCSSDPVWARKGGLGIGLTAGYGGVQDYAFVPYGGVKFQMGNSGVVFTLDANYWMKAKWKRPSTTGPETDMIQSTLAVHFLMGRKKRSGGFGLGLGVSGNYHRDPPTTENKLGIGGHLIPSYRFQMSRRITFLIEGNLGVLWFTKSGGWYQNLFYSGHAHMGLSIGAIVHF